MVDGPARSRFELVDRNIASVSHNADVALTNLKTALQNWTPGDPKGAKRLGGSDDRGISTCEPGEYAVGVHIWGSPGSTKYCIGCVDGIQVLCRKLNAAK